MLQRSLAAVTCFVRPACPPAYSQYKLTPLYPPSITQTAPCTLMMHISQAPVCILSILPGMNSGKTVPLSISRTSPMQCNWNGEWSRVLNKWFISEIMEREPAGGHTCNTSTTAQHYSLVVMHHKISLIRRWRTCVENWVQKKAKVIRPPLYMWIYDWKRFVGFSFVFLFLNEIDSNKVFKTEYCLQHGFRF